MPSKKEMIDAIKSDYPQMPIDMIHLVLDLNEKDEKFISDVIKEEKKKSKGIPKVKRQMNIEELDILTQKFKAHEEHILKSNLANIISSDTV